MNENINVYLNFQDIDHYTMNTNCMIISNMIYYLFVKSMKRKKK